MQQVASSFIIVLPIQLLISLFPILAHFYSPLPAWHVAAASGDNSGTEPALAAAPDWSWPPSQRLLLPLHQYERTHMLLHTARLMGKGGSIPPVTLDAFRCAAAAAAAVSPCCNCCFTLPFIGPVVVSMLLQSASLSSGHRCLHTLRLYTHCAVSRSNPERGCASPSEVDERWASMPAPLRNALLPFQTEGVRFGLARHGRVLIADEMGVGKTVQALALAACYQVGCSAW